MAEVEKPVEPKEPVVSKGIIAVASFLLTLSKIVLSVGVCKHAEHHGAEALGPDVVERLDTLHFRKIDLADEVLILNVGGYIGESTRNELEYAKKMGKVIRFLEGGSNA